MKDIFSCRESVSFFFFGVTMLRSRKLGGAFMKVRYILLKKKPVQTRWMGTIIPFLSKNLI